MNIRAIKSAFALFDNADAVFRLHEHIALLRQRRTEWYHGIAVLLHPLGKLADVIEIAANFQIVVIDIPTGAVKLFSVAQSNADFISVGDFELFFVIRRDKADSTARFLDMAVEPLPHIAVAVKIVIPTGRIAPYQEAVFFGIGTETVLGRIVALKGAGGIFRRILRHNRAAL